MDSRQQQAGSGGWRSYVSIPGASCVAGGLILHLFAAQQGKCAMQLETVKGLDRIDDIAQLVLPTLVALRGRVASSTPKPCELSDKQAVLHEILEEEIYRKERGEQGRVVQDTLEIRHTLSHAEWHLDDGCHAHVRVENAIDASGLQGVLETKQDFQPEQPDTTTMMKLLLEKATKGAVKLGVKRTERYLPVGALVTVIGEVSKDPFGNSSSSSSSRHKASTSGSTPSNNTLSSPSNATAKSSSIGSSSVSPGAGVTKSVGSESSRLGLGSGSGSAAGGGSSGGGYVLRKPVRSGPFYLTTMTLDHLHAAVASRARLLKYTSWGLGVLGLVIMASKAAKALWRMHTGAQLKRRLQAAEAARAARLRAAGNINTTASGGPGQGRAGAGAASDCSSSVGGASSSAAPESDRPPNTCVVCLDADLDLVFSPCGHMCCCHTCGERLTKCPICRARAQPLRVYKP